MRIAIALSFLVFTLPQLARAEPVEISNFLDKPKAQGMANFRFLGKDLFNAELWLEQGKSFSFEQEFALVLTYQTSLNAGLLSWASIREIARQEGQSSSQYDDLGPELKACFADVQPGDRITGVAQSSDTASFYYNGTKTCSLSYPKIRERFFGIWLGPNSRDANASDQLRGVNP